jgi:hypothetical protein
MMRCKNQPIVGVRSLDNDKAEVWPGLNVWGGTMALYWPSNKRRKNKQSKIRHDLRWRAFDDDAHNNQPKIRGRNGAGLREEVRLGRIVQGG